MFSAHASIMVYLIAYMQPAFDLNLPEDITHQVYPLLCRIDLVKHLMIISLFLKKRFTYIMQISSLANPSFFGSNQVCYYINRCDRQYVIHVMIRWRK